MRILVINPNTTEEMTAEIDEQARRYAREGTAIETVSPAFGPRSIECHYEEAVSALAMLETIGEQANGFDGIVIACYGDPGLFAAREISPVPVVGIAEASLLTACTVAHRFSILAVMPRAVPLMHDLARLHGVESRLASVRATPLTVLDCVTDPSSVERELIRAGRTAVELDGAEALCLGCAGMGPLDKAVQAAVGVPVLDGVACAVKLIEGLVDYGLSTSRVAAFKEPEPKEFLNYPRVEVPA